MKYKIAICDDCDADRQYVLNMVHAWAASAGHVVHTDNHYEVSFEIKTFKATGG